MEGAGFARQWTRRLDFVSLPKETEQVSSFKSRNYENRPLKDLPMPDSNLQHSSHKSNAVPTKEQGIQGKEKRTCWNIECTSSTLDYPMQTRRMSKICF